MSTICKLDPNVRLDRYLRKQQRRDMAKDLKTANDLVIRGERQLAVEKIISNNPEYSAATSKLLSELKLRRTVLAMTLKHITDICLDPARTGARKDAILTKLSGPQTADDGVFAVSA
jgi:hypothetical protein